MVGYGGGELELKRCVREAYGSDAQQCGGDGRLRHVRRMRGRVEECAGKLIVRLLGFVSGRRRLLQLRRRRFLSPRGGGFVSSAVVGLDPGGFTLLVWLGLVEISSEDDRSSTMVNGDGSREAFLSVIEMNGDE
ncbi:hypothetical protein F2Q70_00022697 [Brassica cretica]|uniref:Uncharacterized protein n=1 Tax=Brassica cretica TaxID=69181 RepID=A0A8S9GWK8_BRACR|nr:hypothetical protein F2Q70_00022697 [Brassica cretica]